MSVRAVFLWHLHQPEYRDPQTGQPILPWVRQHASRAYTDMAAALERYPQVKAVANWAPSLLSQLEAYVAGTQDADEQLARKPAEALTPEERAHVLREGFSADWNVWVRPVARYSELLDKRGTDLRQIDLLERQAAFTAQELRDLQVQFVLAWMGFTARREEPRISELVAKERGYTEEEKVAAVDAQRRIASRIVPRWRALAERGQVEITCSPFYHPILPLVVDSDSARRAMPAAALPPRFSYPQDAREQVLRGIERARAEFGQAPHGMWPSEGSVSPEVIDLLAACGVRWCATDQGILERSELELGSALPDGYPAHYHPYLAGADHAVTVLFRDRELSDRIGFRYAKSDPREAAQDLISRIADTEPEALVTLALDGENPWEHYPSSGEGFLEARAALAEAEEKGELPRQQLEEARGHLFVAEGSDWFWWYGDDFTTENAPEFDALFRRRVAQAWRALGLPPPERLGRPIIAPHKDAAQAAAVVVQPSRLIEPAIDGYAKGYFEWAGAGYYRPGTTSGGSMFRGQGAFTQVWFGFSRTHLYLRLDPAKGADLTGELRVLLARPGGAGEKTVRIRLVPGGAESPATDERGARCGSGRTGVLVELALFREALGLQPGEQIALTLRILRDEVEVDRLPRYGEIALTVPDRKFELANWRV